MSADLDLSQFEGMTIHGVNCPKLPHNGAGHLHAEDDDSVYDVFGGTYCGRCHRYLTKTDRAVLFLIAEVKRLREENAVLKSQKPRVTMGVGDGSGRLFVHGDYDSIKAAQAIVLERDSLKAEVERLTRERDEWERSYLSRAEEVAAGHNELRKMTVKTAELERDGERLKEVLQQIADMSNTSRESDIARAAIEAAMQTNPEP